jgi:hypothetical protein
MPCVVPLMQTVEMREKASNPPAAACLSLLLLCAASGLVLAEGWQAARQEYGGRSKRPAATAPGCSGWQGAATPRGGRRVAASPWTHRWRARPSARTRPVTVFCTCGCLVVRRQGCVLAFNPSGFRHEAGDVPRIARRLPASEVGVRLWRSTTFTTGYNAQDLGMHEEFTSLARTSYAHQIHSAKGACPMYCTYAA